MRSRHRRRLRPALRPEARHRLAPRRDRPRARRAGLRSCRCPHLRPRRARRRLAAPSPSAPPARSGTRPIAGAVARRGHPLRRRPLRARRPAALDLRRAPVSPASSRAPSRSSATASIAARFPLRAVHRRHAGAVGERGRPRDRRHRPRAGVAGVASLRSPPERRRPARRAAGPRPGSLAATASPPPRSPASTMWWRATRRRLFWHAMTPPPQLRLDTLPPPLRALVRRFEAAGDRVALLEVTTNSRIPSDRRGACLRPPRGARLRLRHRSKSRRGGRRRPMRSPALPRPAGLPAWRSGRGRRRRPSTTGRT